MACTTILVGKHASFDGSTIIARNDDSGAGHFTPKKFVVVHPEEQKRTYRSVLSHVEIELPEHPYSFTAVPNAVAGKGIWAASGVNEKNVAMTATETITSNPRVLGADPLVEYHPAEDGKEEIAGGIGEEDIVCLVLPYINSAREGVLRLGSLLETYGTDDRYVVMPNQFGMDEFDLEDAFGEKKAHLCSPDLKEFIEKNHLDLRLDKESVFCPRDAFGSHTDSDHVYNTPRAWYIERCLNPHTFSWDGVDAEYGPESDDIPWSLVPEKKLTVEDVKYVLSTHYQGTPYDPYVSRGDLSERGKYRAVGINRNDFVAVIQMRPNQPEDAAAIQWLAFASNAFNVLVPFYARVHTTPDYLSNTTKEVSTDNFYWNSRLIAAMTDASYGKSIVHVERYQLAVQSDAYAILHKYDALMEDAKDPEERRILREDANREIADMLKKKTADTLDKVLFELSSQMKNAFSRSDN